jgi:predicted small lipoprotein YifL
MKALIMTLLAVAILTSCGSKGAWLIPDGMDESDFKRDNYECNYQAQALAYGSGYQHHQYGGFAVRSIWKRTYWDCMTSKGYIWTKE